MAAHTKNRTGSSNAAPSRAELDRGRRALDIIEKQMDLGERAGKLLKASEVKDTWGGFLARLSDELHRFPQRAAAQLAGDLRLSPNLLANIEASIAKSVEELRERLEGLPTEGETRESEGPANP